MLLMLLHKLLHDSWKNRPQPWQKHVLGKLRGRIGPQTLLALGAMLCAQTALAAGAASIGAAAAPPIDTIKASADQARQRCYEFMHDDAREYTSCLNALLAAVKGKNPAAQQQKLGIAYFAWVGANNSARLSLPGAEEAAQFYLPKFKALQKQLQLSDETLCLSVAGDCKARVAQITQMEKDIATAKTLAAPPRAGKK